MVDPEKAGAALRHYFATASDQKIVDDLRRISPELAERLGVTESFRPRPRPRPVRDFFASFGRSVHRLFS